jgi:hypothetical protein
LQILRILRRCSHPEQALDFVHIEGKKSFFKPLKADEAELKQP